MKTKPKTKGVITGLSDGESDDDDDDDDEQSTDEEMEGENVEDDSDSIGDIKPKREDMEMEIEEFTLPDTIEGVRDWFNKLYVEFMRHNKREHTNELMFLLDEMLRQGAITTTEYAQLNTSLTEAADLKTDEAEKEEDSDDEEQNLMKPAVDYIIQHDKEELLQLMEEFKDDIDEKFMDIILDIEKLLEIFFEEEFLDGEPIRPQIDELLNKLETPEIPKSNQHRIKMLLDDITKNRYRVEQIIQRLMDAEDKDEMLTTLQLLICEGLLSDEQFKQLGELEDPDFEKIIEVIMDAQIGQGLNFLLRTISKLRHTLHSLLTELEENVPEFIKSKVASILEELFNRNAIRRGEYVNLSSMLDIIRARR